MWVGECLTLGSSIGRASTGILVGKWFMSAEPAADASMLDGFFLLKADHITVFGGDLHSQSLLDGMARGNSTSGMTGTWNCSTALEA